MNALYLLLTALLVVALAYRYYGAFLAAQVVALDDRRPVPPAPSATARTTIPPTSGSSSATTSPPSPARAR